MPHPVQLVQVTPLYPFTQLHGPNQYMYNRATAPRNCPRNCPQHPATARNCPPQLHRTKTSRNCTEPKLCCIPARRRLPDCRCLCTSHRPKVRAGCTRRQQRAQRARQHPRRSPGQIIRLARVARRAHETRRADAAEVRVTTGGTRTIAPERIIASTADATDEPETVDACTASGRDHVDLVLAEARGARRGARVARCRIRDAVETSGAVDTDGGWPRRGDVARDVGVREAGSASAGAQNFSDNGTDSADSDNNDSDTGNSTNSDTTMTASATAPTATPPARRTTIPLHAVALEGRRRTRNINRPMAVAYIWIVCTRDTPAVAGRIVPSGTVGAVGATVPLNARVAVVGRSPARVACRGAVGPCDPRGRPVGALGHVASIAAPDGCRVAEACAELAPRVVLPATAVSAATYGNISDTETSATQQHQRWHGTATSTARQHQRHSRHHPLAIRHAERVRRVGTIRHSVVVPARPVR